MNDGGIFQKYKNRISSKKSNNDRIRPGKGFVRIKTYFMSLRSKIVLTYMVPVMFIFILGYVSYQKASYGIRTNYESSVGDTINMTSAYLNFGFENVKATAEQCSTDTNINAYFRNYYSDDLINKSMQNKSISNLFTSKCLSDKFISNVYCISDTVDTISTTKRIESGTYQGFLLARRLGNEISVKRYEKDLYWDDMIEELWEYQWLKEYIPLTKELKDVFYEETAGIIDRVINLFEAVQLDAILQENESVNDISPEYVKKISVKYFSTTRDVLYALSKGEEVTEKWDDLYDRKADKNSVNVVANALNEKRAKEIILDNTRKTENITITSLRNNIITNIVLFLKDRYPVSDIEKAFEFLYKKHKKKILDMDEKIINGLVLDLLADPEQMIKKPKRDEVKYDLPGLEGLL